MTSTLGLPLRSGAARLRRGPTSLALPRSGRCTLLLVRSSYESRRRYRRGPLPADTLGGDRVALYVDGTLITELDGRYWTAETCASFTGRVIGMYASEGSVAFRRFRYSGRDA